ncbi:MAG: TIGR03960 family B12-binding radical SAM protein [Deltaproteobacteria bacterium]|nr:TIGR03960 family B12-binding radical SAM protein [Deltaproteobacteria bacterium]
MGFDYQLLNGVEKPGRYLNHEFNAVHKELKPELLHIALAFPDLYELGMSNYGFLLLYQLLNRRHDFYCERVFAPAADFAENLRRWGTALFSLESSTPLAAFDVLGFSLSYEMAYSNVLLMLEQARIPWAALDRDEKFPLLIAGGPSMVNPEPVAPLFDAVLVGDGEEAFVEIGELVLKAKAESWGKAELLSSLAKLEGVYVPTCFQARNGPDGYFLQPGDENSPVVRRRVFSGFTRQPPPHTPPVPLIQVVHDRLALEISRGCSRGCRFCQAGMTYRPVREQPPAGLFAAAKAGAAATGMEELSLLSLSVGDYSKLKELVEKLPFYCPGLDLSLPSVRAGVLNESLLEALRKNRQGGFTIAPEAGTQRLRDVINKGLSEAQILETISLLFARGWDLIKLYFMIGLPTETDADLEGIIELCRQALARSKNKRQRLNVSVSTFIPKPHTPFQWEAQIGLVETRRRQEIISQGLKRIAPGSRLNFKWHDSRVSLLEGVFSRGDRRLWPVLQRARQLGCAFDAWSDKFDFALWNEAFRAEGFDLEELAAFRYQPGDYLPWSHIDCRVSEKFLKKERERAFRQEATDDCRYDGCQGCGVCRSVPGPSLVRDEIGEIVNAALPPVKPLPEILLPDGQRQEWRYQVDFARSVRLAYLSHLETVALIIRGFRRLGLPLACSHGFHPHPKLSFAHALPLGLPSRHEVMEFRTISPVDYENLGPAWESAFPPDLGFISAASLDLRQEAVDRRLQGCVYEVRAQDDFWRVRLSTLTVKAAAVIAGSEALLLERSKKGGIQVVDLTPHLVAVKSCAEDCLRLEIAVLGGRNPNVFDILKCLAALDQRPESGLAVVKINSIMKEDG